MTELHHGSNVAALQTEAVLDVATDEWIINTPDEGALKWYTLLLQLLFFDLLALLLCIVIAESPAISWACCAQVDWQCCGGR